MFKVVRNHSYDFIDEKYSTLYPQIHKYPATMLPQIGVKILNEFDTKSSAKLLDPYCGSGSSFASGLDVGIKDMTGYDLNPLAILISSVKFTKINTEDIIESMDVLRGQIYGFLSDKNAILNPPDIKNIDFWFKPNVIKFLSIIKHFVLLIKNKDIQKFFLVVFSELVRECSNTRNNEFKLYRMKPDDVLAFNPDVLELFWSKCENAIEVYKKHYFGKIRDLKIRLNKMAFTGKEKFDVVLTSPPYGDSRTTVAYGQFSALSNEWLGVEKARRVDKKLMGGVTSKDEIKNSLMCDYIKEIGILDKKRASEVNAFYSDLKDSISKVAQSINRGGKAFYIVGNRMVKGIRLPTDQFIAESFQESGLRHVITYERLLSNKSMPKSNSPTNKKGITKETMNREYIVCCEKI